MIEITQVLGKNSPHSDWDRFERSNDDEVDERFKWARRGYRYYLAVTQAHYQPVGENGQTDAGLVEGGQLHLIAVPKGVR